MIELLVIAIVVVLCYISIGYCLSRNIEEKCANPEFINQAFPAKKINKKLFNIQMQGECLINFNEQNNILKFTLSKEEVDLLYEARRTRTKVLIKFSRCFIKPWNKVITKVYKIEQTV